MTGTLYSGSDCRRNSCYGKKGPCLWKRGSDYNHLYFNEHRMSWNLLTATSLLLAQGRVIATTLYDVLSSPIQPLNQHHLPYVPTPQWKELDCSALSTQLIITDDPHSGENTHDPRTTVLYRRISDPPVPKSCFNPMAFVHCLVSTALAHGEADCRYFFPPRVCYLTCDARDKMPWQNRRSCSVDVWSR